MMNLLPAPKKVTEKSGNFPLAPCDVVVIGQHDVRVIRAAVKLKDALAKKTGSFHRFCRKQEPVKQAICIQEGAGLPHEGYTLEIDEDGIRLVGGDAAGCFYGIQTLMQLVEGAQDSLACVSIEDAPDMAHRGFYHDATRGRVPTVDGVKRIVDMLARLKVNSLQLYVEHSFDFFEFSDENRTAEDHLTAQDILDIDEYCYDHFIDFIPSLATFGHLYGLLMTEKYKHLRVLQEYEPQWHFWREQGHHHTIDPTNPESIQVIYSLIDQYLPLFRTKYFNICCDETFDLGKGKNEGKDIPQLYIGFVSQVAKHVTEAGKTAMMWGDIALEHPELLPQIPEDTILLNWCYEANPNLNQIVQVAKQGVKQIVCPGVSGWYKFMETPSTSVPNITKMLRTGYENGVIGALNTNWGNRGHPAHFECVLYGTTLGACLSWNIDTQVNEEFDLLVSSMVYGTEKNVVSLVKELGDLQLTGSWEEFVEWYTLRNKSCFKSEIGAMETAADRCREIQEELSRIDDKNEVLHPIIVAARVIELLKRAAIQIVQNGKMDAAMKAAFERWLEEYKPCWLRYDKPSELIELEKFVQSICS